MGKLAQNAAREKKQTLFKMSRNAANTNKDRDVVGTNREGDHPAFHAVRSRKPWKQQKVDWIAPYWGLTARFRLAELPPLRTARLRKYVKNKMVSVILTRGMAYRLISSCTRDILDGTRRTQEICTYKLNLLRPVWGGNPKATMVATDRTVSPCRCTI